MERNRFRAGRNSLQSDRFSVVNWSSGAEMRRINLVRIAGYLSVLLLFSDYNASGQKLGERPRQSATRSLAYNATQETMIEGTVQTYTAKPATPPGGPSVLLQPASATTSVHFGSPSYLGATLFS